MALAFVFPGQGSQSVGMLSELAAAEPIVGTTFEEASDALGYDLWALIQDGPAEELARTERTQPAMLAAGVAVWRVWRQRGGPSPTVMSGHSLGEYTALVCADSLDFSTAIKLVEFRGQMMQEAVPAGEGAMAAIIGLTDRQVASACEEGAHGGGVCEPVNFNAPNQIVIAGHAPAVDRAMQSARDKGAKRVVLLQVSVPSHSSLMRPAAERMRERLEDTPFRHPLVPEIYTVDIGRHGYPDDIRAALVEQLYKPVRWVDTIRSMVKEGVNAVVECGPGKVLMGLNRRIERRRELGVYGIYDPATVDEALAACREVRANG
ncbi:MAG: ACP S-malonyltransferase [Pseudomonadota bacterium]